MIKFYDILINEQSNPYLHVKKEWKECNKNLSIEDIINILHKYDKYKFSQSERVYVAALNHQADVIGIYMVSSGSTDTSYYIQRNIFTFLLLVGATQFVTFHNHPSNSLDRSLSDDNAYQLTKNSADIFKITYTDNIVVTRNGFYSYKDMERYKYS